MKNSLALVITENDVSHIKDLYRQTITEQAQDKPEDIKAFQDWLDTTYPEWLNGKKLNKGKGYGTFGPNTKKAWEAHKEEFKGGKKEFRYWDSVNKQWSGLKTSKELNDLYNASTITDETIVHKLGMGRNETITLSQTDVINTPAPYNAPTTTTTTVAPQEPYSDYERSEFGDQERGSKQTPFAQTDDKFKFNDQEEFKRWYKTIYQGDLPAGATITFDTDKKTAKVENTSLQKSLVYQWSSNTGTYETPTTDQEVQKFALPPAPAKK
jgi:hypothetical protein